MKLWLDDLRPAPEGWTQAKTRDEAIAILQTGEVTEASLDHDINWDPGGTVEEDDDWLNTRTGLAVVLWMERNNVWPRDGVHVHSETCNVMNLHEMFEIIERHGCKTTSE